MAGTLTISTLSDGTNSTSATNVVQGSAKAWVRFNGVTTATVAASYNISSVTRNGTGYYTINMTNALTDANYSVVGTASVGSGSTLSVSSFTGTSGTTYTAGTTSSFTVCSSNLTVAAIDSSAISIAVFR